MQLNLSKADFNRLENDVPSHVLCARGHRKGTLVGYVGFDDKVVWGAGA